MAAANADSDFFFFFQPIFPTFLIKKALKLVKVFWFFKNLNLQVQTRYK